MKVDVGWVDMGDNGKGWVKAQDARTVTVNKSKARVAACVAFGRGGTFLDRD